MVRACSLKRHYDNGSVTELGRLSDPFRCNLGPTSRNLDTPTKLEQEEKIYYGALPAVRQNLANYYTLPKWSSCTGIRVFIVTTTI